MAKRSSASDSSSSVRDVREHDEPIPLNEQLYRWLSDGDLNGSEVLPHVVDLEGMSVDREKYLPDGLPPHQSGHPERNGVAVTSVARLPSNLRLNDIEYEFFAVDRPEEDNDAHAEVRPGRSVSSERPAGDRPDGFKPKSKSTKEGLRAALAEVLTLVRAPVPPT